MKNFGIRDFRPTLIAWGVGGVTGTAFGLNGACFYTLGKKISVTANTVVVVEVFEVFFRDTGTLFKSERQLTVNLFGVTGATVFAHGLQSFVMGIVGKNGGREFGILGRHGFHQDDVGSLGGFFWWPFSSYCPIATVKKGRESR